MLAWPFHNPISLYLHMHARLYLGHVEEGGGADGAHVGGEAVDEHGDAARRGGRAAQRHPRLDAARQAAEKINKIEGERGGAREQKLRGMKEKR